MCFYLLTSSMSLV